MTGGPYPPTTRSPLDALVALARSGEDADWAIRVICHLLSRDDATCLPETPAPFEDEPYDFCEQPT